MKILELRFKNLNSLYGEWFIDFTDPEYVSNGIFALIGPTGAGKSTILDAICLALYGATPRLGKITQSANEIMSRQVGECYAEVLFESQAGRFRCHWEHRRSRKKADGALQIPEHQIIDAYTGKPIETKKSLVAGFIEKKTGMDFDRFTRSILLAQGGFDTFLKANVEQKSQILEQITGTEIYSKISERVHERHRGEREILTLLQAETAGIVILEQEHEQELQQALESQQKQEAELSVQSTKVEKSIAWLTNIDKLKEEELQASKEANKLEIEVEAFKGHRERLNQASKATVLEGSYGTLTAVRKQQSTDQALHKTEEEKLPMLEDAYNQLTKCLKASELKTLKVKEELKQATPIIHRIRSLDQKLSEHKKAVSEREQSCSKTQNKINSDKQLQIHEQKKRIVALDSQKLADQYLKDHSQDEWLISGLAGIEAQLTTLLIKQKEVSKNEIEIEKASTVLEQATKKLEGYKIQCGTRKQELEDASTKHRKEKDALNKLLDNRLLREYRTEKETLLREMTFIATIANLEDHRVKLEDGKSCPLCGSLEHPFAEGNIPLPDETEKKIEALDVFIQKVEDQETLIKKLERAEGVALKLLTESEKLEAGAINHMKGAEKSLSDLTTRVTTARSEFIDLKAAVLKKLQPLGIEEIPGSNIPSLLESLRERLKKWQTHLKKKSEIEKQISELDSDLKRLDAVIEAQNYALEEKQKEFDCLKKEYDEGSVQRRELYADKNPNEEELRLNKAVDDAELSEKQTVISFNKLQQELTSTKADIGSLKKRILHRDTELEKLESDFSTLLQAHDFIDEKLFLEARITAEERDVLTKKAKELDNGLVDLKARQKDRKSRLATEIDKKLTTATLDELEPQYKELKESLKQLSDAIAGHKHKLNQNSIAKERIKEKQGAIDSQKNEFLRWEKLHSLIGSKDGKKYRKFAQALTFELMVSHANRQLDKMTDRYLLIRDDKEPLELNVIDNYQAGEIRSTKNLSGGESFIVSLSLALGLSKMASQKVRVDSLFLDEGFGTLDEDALETALETLSSLQQDGKLIGIISHVTALKERISTQITVTPISGGRSTLAGPGCNKVSAANKETVHQLEESLSVTS